MDVEVQGITLYSTHTLDLMWALESASPAFCKTLATSVDCIHPNKHPKRNKILKKDQTPNKLYHIDLLYVRITQA